MKAPKEIWVDPVVGASDIEIIKAYRKKIMFDFIKYIRADIAAEKITELKAEIDRLKEENKELLDGLKIIHKKISNPITYFYELKKYIEELLNKYKED